MELITILLFFFAVFLAVFIVKKIFKVVLVFMLFFILIFGVFGYIVYQDYQEIKSIFEDGDVNLIFYSSDEIQFGYNVDFSGEKSYEELQTEESFDYDVLKGYSDLLLLIEVDFVDDFVADEVSIENYNLDKGEVLNVLKGNESLENVSQTDLFLASVDQSGLDNGLFFKELVDLYRFDRLIIYKEPLSLKIVRAFGLLNPLERYINK